MTKRPRHPALEHLEAMVGEWNLTGSHPYMPGVAIRGRATYEWFDGGFFLIARTKFENPEIPNGIMIIGETDAHDAESVGMSHGKCELQYFDARGVARVYHVEASPGSWKMWRDDPGFSQRMTYTISADGQSGTGKGEMARDGKPWEPDLQLTYQRAR
jgi:hypothetical protein